MGLFSRKNKEVVKDAVNQTVTTSAPSQDSTKLEATDKKGKTSVKSPAKSKKAHDKKSVKKSDQKITPLGDRILLKPLSQDEMNTTASGIIIPDTVSKEKPEQGMVIAVGEGRWDDGKRVPMSVKVGDKVVFSRYGYEEVKVDGEEYYILKEENILAIIR